MNFYDITIKPDTRWPADENGNLPLAGYLSGRRILGWWTRDEFNAWMTAHLGKIRSEADGTIEIVARLTKKQAKG